MRWTPPGYGGERRAPEQVKREGWRDQGILVVAEDDARLTWPERELIRQLGEKLYGKRPTAEARQIRWTQPMVEERLAEAADVMRRLPDVRAPGYFNTWPKILPEFSDLVGQEPPRLKRLLPSSDAITRMDETLGWLRWLEGDDAKLVWARAEGARWKAICWRFGIALATAKRRQQYALSLIAWKLNGRPIAAKTSRRAFMERARLSR